MNKLKRLLLFLPSVAESDGIRQVTSCNGTFNTGSLPLIRRPITALFGNHDMVGLQHGSSRPRH
jgi:hypothetical protein